MAEVEAGRRFAKQAMTFHGDRVEGRVNPGIAEILRESMEPGDFGAAKQREKVFELSGEEPEREFRGLDGGDGDGSGAVHDQDIAREQSLGFLRGVEIAGATFGEDEPEFVAFMSPVVGLLEANELQAKVAGREHTSSAAGAVCRRGTAPRRKHEQLLCKLETATSFAVQAMNWSHSISSLSFSPRRQLAAAASAIVVAQVLTCPTKPESASVIYTYLGQGSSLLGRGEAREALEQAHLSHRELISCAG